MGYHVHIHIAFACDTNEGVAALAKKHRTSIDFGKGHGIGGHEAAAFLDDLSERTGSNPGPKGGLSLWGITGNYTDG